MDSSNDSYTINYGYDMTYGNEGGGQYTQEESNEAAEATGSQEKYHFEENPMPSLKNVQPGKDGKFKCIRNKGKDKCKVKCDTRRDLL